MALQRQQEQAAGAPDLSIDALHGARRNGGIAVGVAPDIPVIEPTLENAETRTAISRPTRRTIAESLALAMAAEAPRRSIAYRSTTHVVDVVFASILLVATVPVIAALVLLIRIDSRGPAIFRQTRVGRNGRLFRFYKFRTMYVDASARFPDLYAYDFTQEEVETMYFKLPDDPRCTRVGRWLRRTSLDELPNLTNIIRGDMAIVGPRPEIPEMLEHYGTEQFVKFAVKPGLTGLSQIRGRNLLSFQQTIETDLEYVARHSLRCDLGIIVRTPCVVARMIGAL